MLLLKKKDTFCTAIKKIDKKKLSSSQKYWVSLGVIDMGFNGFFDPPKSLSVKTHTTLASFMILSLFLNQSIKRISRVKKKKKLDSYDQSFISSLLWLQTESPCHLYYIKCVESEKMKCALFLLNVWDKIKQKW